MSDLREVIGEFKGLIAAVVAAFTVMSGVGLAILEWRVDSNVTAALAALDLGTDTKIVTMDTNIADNKRTGEENGEDILQNRDDVRAAFRRLMGMPPPETPDAD